MRPRQQAGHMIAFEPKPISRKPTLALPAVYTWDHATFPATKKAIIIYDGSDITRAEGADQLGRPRVYLGFPLEVLGKPAATRLNHCP